MYTHTTDIHNTRAAEHVLPYLFNIFSPKSVLDVGCGLGTWLKVAKDLGANEILGIDGPHLDRELLVIDESDVLIQDLKKPAIQSRRFDLVICLEVIEHLPAVNANALLDSLVAAGDRILFAGAIPGQGGQNHQNEQWQSYWAKMFIERGFKCYDFVRPRFWHVDEVDWWYRQNTLFFSKDNIPGYDAVESVMDLVHPELYRKHLWRIEDLQYQLDAKVGSLNMLEEGKLGVRYPLSILWASLKKRIKLS